MSLLNYLRRDDVEKAGVLKNIDLTTYLSVSKKKKTFIITSTHSKLP